MSKQFSPAIRQFIALRANFRCEYCLKPDIVANFSFHIEHIISQQHGGSDNLNNLAYACSHCNWKKGPNISTVLNENEPIIPLYNPRTSNWADHFALEGGIIRHKTIIGAGTIRLLEFNAVERILERIELIAAGIYP